jgi:hydrogenase maturation factor
MREGHPTSSASPDVPLQRAVGTIVAIVDDDVVVNIDGILRRASAANVPRLRVGDWVMVGVGSVLGVVDRAHRSRR